MPDAPTTIAGTVRAAPQYHRSPNTDTPVLGFEVDCHAPRRYDQQAGAWVVADSRTVHVTCHGPLAENLWQSGVRPGEPVHVRGRMHTREWTGEDGDRHASHEMDAMSVAHNLKEGPTVVEADGRQTADLYMVIAAGLERSRRVDDALMVTPLLEEPKFAFDVAKGELSGEHPTVTNRVSDRAYYLLTGTATVRAYDREHHLKPGHLVAVKAGTPHSITGHATYLVVTAPPYNPANEETIGR